MATLEEFFSSGIVEVMLKLDFDADDWWFNEFDYFDDFDVSDDWLLRWLWWLWWLWWLLLNWRFSLHWRFWRGPWEFWWLRWLLMTLITYDFKIPAWNFKSLNTFIRKQKIPKVRTYVALYMALTPGICD